MATPGEPSITSSARFSGGIDTVISVEEVARQAQAIAQEVSLSDLDALANNAPHLRIDDLRAGYGRMEILHDFNLRIGRKQALCLIGPNGAGKSTVLHSIFGFTQIFSGSISPETIHVGRSIDGLVMVLLGGIQTLSGPIVGASVFAVLQDTVMRQTEYWRALLGVIILLLVLAFTKGIAGAVAQIFSTGRRAS
jgi:hypothetical protein